MIKEGHGRKLLLDRVYRFSLEFKYTISFGRVIHGLCQLVIPIILVLRNLPMNDNVRSVYLL